jgi:exopolysaccharide production protein ExoZ
LSSSSQKIETVELGRGLAAFAVLLLHAEGMLLPAKNGVAEGFGGLFRFGFLGVDFFFVLSGFIIYFVHARHVGDARQAPAYLMRRLFRILPTYWAVFAILIVLLPFQRTWPTLSLEWFASQFSLSTLNLWVGQAWTLQHEFLFYLIFSALIVFGRFGWFLLVAWVLACVVMSYGSLNVARTSWFELVFHPYHLMFLAGMCTAWAARLDARVWRLYAGAVGMLVLLAVWALVQANDSLASHTALRYYAAAVFGNAVLVVLLALGRTSFEVPRVFTWLGKISYSVYICHGLVLMVCKALLERIGSVDIPRTLVFCSGVVLCLLASHLLQYWVEQPGIALGKRLIDRLQTRLPLKS